MVDKLNFFKIGGVKNILIKKTAYCAWNFFSLFRPTVLCVDFCTRFKNLMAQKQSYFVPRKSVVVDGSAETHLFTFLKTERIFSLKKYNFWLRSSSTKFLFFISVQHQCKII